jgi:hypothetical protein
MILCVVPSLHEPSLYSAANLVATQIYIDPSSLGLNMGSWYQPQEKVQWWYQKGQQSSTMISGAGTVIAEYDMSRPNPGSGFFYTSTTYLYSAGKWQNSPMPPQSLKVTGALTPSGSRPSVPGNSPRQSDIDALQRKM